MAGIHARMLLSKKRGAFHGRALVVALLVGAPAAIAQPLAGDFAARVVARTQPAKLAAMEGQFQTERGAPLRIGGVPDQAAGTTRHALEIPRGLSVMAYGNPNALVQGLDAFPRSDWPPIAIVHVAFQIMVAIGVALAGLALWAAWLGDAVTSVPVLTSTFAAFTLLYIFLAAIVAALLRRLVLAAPA